MNRLLLWAVVPLCFAVLGARAASAAELTAQQKQEMRQHYERATRAYDVGKYDEAIEEYKKAFEIGGDPPMLYNIAQALRLSDQPAEAVRYYRRYLQRQPNARNREDVERRIAELEKVMEDRRKASPPPPPSGPSPAYPQPASTPPPPPESSAAPAPGATPGQQQPTPPPPPPSTATRKILAWSLIGVGAVAGGLGAWQATVARDRADEVGRLSRQVPPTTFDSKLEDEGQSASTRAIILASIGGAAMVAGIVVLFTARSSAESDSPGAPVISRVMVAPWVGPGGGVVGAGANLRF